MNQETLDLIGRLHTVEQIRETFAMARQMGFDSINTDLIVGLPNRLQANARNVEQLRLGNGHILFDDRAQAVLV